MLPNFLNIGAAKCASTWLWTVFQEHPDICVPVAPVRDYSGKMTKPDDVNFFVADFHRGLDWYQQTYFAHWNGEKAVGEFSNGYMLDELALARIAESLPGVRLTLVMRNPIDRAFLQYVMHRRSQLERPSDTFRSVLDIHSWQKFRMYVEPGYYHHHLTRVLRHFPRERVLPLIYDDLVRDPRAFLKPVYKFLEVAPRFDLPTIGKIIGFPRPEEPDTPDGDLARGMDDETRERLRAIFADQTRRLEDFLGRDLSAWR